ncbi:hypothetical protein GCM10011415_01700 [Salipiger pallidus]|uniref:Uncharacterized protein n=1 Tax=Salipiger pallidus TaxID=1775170 RepID=A0A8J2ZG94_9RHOB|nr:hypothetical protein GCM10011415_01700 [Salipiger pallidus]
MQGPVADSVTALCCRPIWNVNGINANLAPGAIPSLFRFRCSAKGALVIRAILDTNLMG